MHYPDFHYPLGATKTSPGTATETIEDEELQSVWVVIVHNDPINLMSYVTLVFQKVFGFTLEKAEQHMMEVHHNGKSIVWSGDREKAEHYVQVLHGYQLLATLEKN